MKMSALLIVFCLAGAVTGALGSRELLQSDGEVSVHCSSEYSLITLDSSLC